MNKNKIIKNLLDNFGDCLNEKILIALLTLDGMSEKEIKYIFSENNAIAEYIEPLLLKSYQTKLFLENLEYREIDMIENVTCDNIGNTMFVFFLRYLKAFEFLCEYFEENNINSISRTYYYCYVKSIKTANNIKKIIEKTNNNIKISNKLNLLNLELQNNLDIQLQCTLQNIMHSKVNMDIYRFEEAIIDYYFTKVNLMTLYNPNAKTELEQLVNLIKNSNIEEQLLKELHDELTTYERVNQEIIKEEETLAKILRK